MKTLAKFRRYQQAIAADGVAPITFKEWYLGLVAGRIVTATAKMALNRGDHASLNHTLLATWAGNQSSGGHLIGALKPWELSRAIRENRVRLIVDEPAPTTTPAR
ncbi:hypothetical protein [Pseudarthrobacter sp. BIM B-2242]|uniref:hypothetical protein n=1 Tax=Pseudarthrobacter sp. BIM B-2242 TaxID=2772401 RepID=UPI00168B4E1F|nr:hypothetical protein [Pseudarthrobacter sp. BIM B-2242]QOD05660.1 hypothetical protein IDT60_21700 [Pseudarthrobacter sp. BIM B-2242]